jgi:hypothetical protein
MSSAAGVGLSDRLNFRNNFKFQFPIPFILNNEPSPGFILKGGPVERSSSHRCYSGEFAILGLRGLRVSAGGSPLAALALYQTAFMPLQRRGEGCCPSAIQVPGSFSRPSRTARVRAVLGAENGRFLPRERCSKMAYGTSGPAACVARLSSRGGAENSVKGPVSLCFSETWCGRRARAEVGRSVRGRAKEGVREGHDVG